jgi:uncharacterized protein YjbI with pentapeptide repeats
MIMRSILNLILLTLLLSVDACCTSQEYTREVFADEILANISKGYDVILDNVIIKDEINLSYKRLPTISITNSKIEGKANFSSSIFGEKTFFAGSEFQGLADFNDAKFCNNASFWNAGFDREASFCGSEFYKDADFRWAKFYSKYSGYADFTGAKFYKNVNFYGSEFSKAVTFNGAQFKGITNFNVCSFSGYANFIGIVLPEEKRNLSMERAQFEKLYIRYNDIKGRLTFNDEAYLAIIVNYRKLGWLEDADKCYLEYRAERRMQPDMDFGFFGLGKPVDFLLERFYGYGTKPDYALWCCIISVSIFACFWFVLGLKAKDAFIFSVAVFLSGTKLFVDPPSIPRKIGMKKSRIRDIRVLFIVERVLGALFSVLFFLAIGRTIIR